MLKALATIGELTADQAPYLGKFLAEQLVEDAVEAEYQKQLDSYRSEGRTAFTDEHADLAYEPTDPKHPRFLDRTGAYRACLVSGRAVAARRRGGDREHASRDSPVHR